MPPLSETRDVKNRTNPPWARKNVVLAFFAVLAAIPIIVFLFTLKSSNRAASDDEFVRLSNTGKNLYDRSDANGSVTTLEKALALNPSSVEAHLNVANAYLKANIPDKALFQAQEAIKVQPSSGAAHFLAGSAYLRMGQAKPAAQELEQAKAIDRTINAVSFQLGRAYQLMGQNEQAFQQFGEVVKFEPDHSAAHYTLSQVLRLLGKPDEGSQELAAHQALMKGKEGRITDPSQFERCQYTQIRLPFRPEQPDARGLDVTFVDNSAAAFGQNAGKYRGPAAVMDPAHEGNYQLLVMDGDTFRLLANSNGIFEPTGEPLPANPASKYSRALVGDVNNDHAEDVLILGDKGSHAFKMSTNGTMSDVSRFSRMAHIGATSAVLADLDYSAKLGLALIDTTNGALHFLRNLGNPYFSEYTTNAGIPANLTGAQDLLVDDWNNDELLDLLLLRTNQPPLLLLKQRAGPFAPTNAPADWPAASVVAAGDLNGDLQSDIVFGTASELTVLLHGSRERQAIPFPQGPPTHIDLVDYDNDGWLDIITIGPGLRVWRNTGKAGFVERTTQLGLDKLRLPNVASIWPADLDRDGDTDLLVTLADNSLRVLRNDGGNKNHQVKLYLSGQKANPSSLGVRFEVAAGGLRLSRRVQRLPVEVGVGSHQDVDSVKVFWDSELSMGDIKASGTNVVAIIESAIREGSCPFLHAWDGGGFRFVTDLLGASPVGLPLSEQRYIDGDPEEYVSLGGESKFPAKDGHYTLQLTEELREVLYLDEAKLVIVDHPAGTEVHTTGKLLPSKPFPPHILITLHKPHPLLRAMSDQGRDITDLVREEDGKFLSPAKPRPSQFAGLAEPHGVTLDFGFLEAGRPLVLALTGWLRFGGGTANIAASHNTNLPLPFPTLEAELPDGTWSMVDIVVGAPAGKTKRIIVDLSGKLPAGTRRLRLATAFEIHWDRIALLEKRDNSDTTITTIASSHANLHWRGYSHYKDLPWHQPLTPDYASVRPNPPWAITPTGWCTRYGEIGELIEKRDNGLALLNGGDELTLGFDAATIKPKPENNVRDFFFYSVGWDKDANIHCKLGSQVEPLPWHGMDDQKYGDMTRPNFSSDLLHEKYNTRWVGPHVLSRN